jgi:cation diffusion facilitator CzcD-associated flavoprotein CzcO
LPADAVDSDAIEAVDALIVGAGLSGIAAAVHLQRARPRDRVAIIEARSVLGGTWDLFRYPGVRSDSDMYTLSYGFRPWQGERAIGQGPEILQYLRDTAREFGVDERIRYGHRLLRADWNSEDAAWTVTLAREGLPPLAMRARFLFMCTGYYDYAQPHCPRFEGEESFAGTIVHPQCWPEGLDIRGKRIAVIGSGATAVSLVPALAIEAAQVTIVQRSPSYVVPWASRDPSIQWLRRLLPAALVHRLARAKYVARDLTFFHIGRRAPWLGKRILRAMARWHVGRGFDLATHFTPRYRPWEQRLCLAPDGDLFDCLRTGRVEMRTGEIAGFEAEGLRLRSGELLPADIIVTATGLRMELMTGVELRVDGEAVRLGETLGYRGCMYSGVPNLVSTFGYSNASWTLKAELICEYACRVLAHLERSGARYCVPDASGVAATGEGPLNLDAGYVQRARERLPKQGERQPWRNLHNYLLDRWLYRRGRVDDGALRFHRTGRR